jgi:hypothetical protein
VGLFQTDGRRANPQTVDKSYIGFNPVGKDKLDE